MTSLFLLYNTLLRETMALEVELLMDKATLKEIYRSVEEKLSNVQFELIWPNFLAFDFALYFEDSMCFQGKIHEKPTSFMGNTSILHEGAHIAIWDMRYTKIEGEKSLELLTANIVHEMFHAFQRQMGETRFPHDLELLLYPHDAELTALTRREYAILTDEKQSPALRLEGIAGIRNEKIRRIGRFCEEEYLAETAEGLAEYAGLKALSQINWPLFMTMRDRYESYLLDDRYLFDVRRRAYYSGVLIAFLAEAAGLTLYHPLSEKRPVWTLLDVPAVPFQALNTTDIDKARSLFVTECERREALLQSFKKRFPNERPSDAAIVGYDPMNLTRVGDWLISTHVIMLNDENIPQPMMGDHLLKMKAGSARKVQAIAY